MAVTQTMPREQARYAGVVPVHIVDLVLTLAGGAVTFTVPASCKYIRIEATANTWFSDGTATIPVASITDGTGSALLAAGKERFFRVHPAETISFIAGQDTTVAIECYETTFESLGA
jgi:hypothetical protein